MWMFPPSFQEGSLTFLFCTHSSSFPLFMQPTLRRPWGRIGSRRSPGTVHGSGSRGKYPPHSVAIRADGFFLTTPPKHLARRSQVVLPAYAAPVCHRNSSVTKEVIMLEVKVRQPKCTFCPYHHRHAEACGTKLKGVICAHSVATAQAASAPGYSNRKTQKRRCPPWCPRRITPCAVRVYHYKNPDTELLQKPAPAKRYGTIRLCRRLCRLLRKPHSH